MLVVAKRKSTAEAFPSSGAPRVPRAYGDLKLVTLGMPRGSQLRASMQVTKTASSLPSGNPHRTYPCTTPYAQTAIPSSKTC